MDDSFKQISLLFVSLTVPVLLLLLKRQRLLLAWVGFTLFVHLFDTTIYTNLPAGRLVGLVFIPSAVFEIRRWLSITPVKAWLVSYSYLIVLALVFGFIDPWPDSTFARPFSLTAPGKSIVYSVRLLSDFSLAVFIANQLKQPGSLKYLLRAMVSGATVTALAGLLYLINNFDLYYFITGLGEQILNIDRARGLSIEPRAMGLACAYGVMILLLGRAGISRYWVILLLINLTGLMISYSASSFVLLIIGVVVASIFFSNRERLFVAVVVVLTVILIVGATMYAPEQLNYAMTTLQMRLDPEYKLAGIPTGNLGQEIAYRLDVFDASAMLFLLDQPVYAITGTGPGLVPLPASYYVPPGLYSVIWTPNIGINSPPSHGLLLEIANAGVFGLMLWLVQVITCWKSLKFAVLRINDPRIKSEWELAESLFLIGSLFYLIQVSSSPVWSVFLAIGWVSSRVVSEYKSRKPVAVRGVDPVRSAAGIA